MRNGWIEFIPVDGTIGNPFSAKIHEDGSFEADRVAVGVNLIRLGNTSLSSKKAERLFGAYHSPIRRIIPARSTEPIVINVFDEAVRFKMRPPGSQSAPPKDAETRNERRLAGVDAGVRFSE